MSQDFINAILDMNEEEVLKTSKKMLDSGTSPMEVLNLCRNAMEEVGKRFEAGQYFIPELMMAGDMIRQISEQVKPLLNKDGEAERKLGKVVFGTVQGDIHDIAKDIVVFMLDINGFEVKDLGVDVPPQKFVDAVKDTGAKIVGLSGFLTLAFDPMKETVSALKSAGFKDVKVMIGGGQIDDQIRAYTGADAYGKDAMAAVTLAKQWTGGK